MKNNLALIPKVGVISVTDVPREQGLVDEREQYINKGHHDLIKYLINNNIDVVDVSSKITRTNHDLVAIYKYSDARDCIKVMVNEDVEALIIGCWHWCEPMLIVTLAREFNKPILLYSDGNPNWAGITLISAAGASLWQNAPNSYSIAHKRVYGDKSEIIKWIKGVTAIEKLKKGTFILWGGSYALAMEYLQDDYSKLKSFLVGDIINEDQYVLIKYSENISDKRLNDFADWLKVNKTVIKYDDKMLTEDIFRKQIALYLAAKDRINEYENVMGVSVKCFTELSDIYGVDSCFLPAFLPYFEDSEGKKDVVPCVCEGDIKALICSSLLQIISGGKPSLFGDILYFDKDYLLMGNCGASSIYYSCLSKNVKEVLKGITIAQNFEGSGGAVSYNTCKDNLMTMVRLLRLKDEYTMLLGLMQTIEIKENIRSKTCFYRNWPLTALKFNVHRDLLVDSLGSNHLIGITGDFTDELTYSCNIAGIKTFRIDNNEEIKNWISYSISKAKHF
jgi:L-fucose isomerase-like protein